MAIIAIAIIFGGGGSHYGIANSVVLLSALFVLGFHRQAFVAFRSSASFPLRALAVLSILLPIAHLVPLPHNVWSGLPGREMVERSFELAGGGPDNESWAPLSVDPVRTLLALTALIVPVAVLSIGWTARRDSLVLAGWAIVGLGILQLLLGVVQVLSNGEAGLLYPENPMPGALFGLFANRNSTGLFMVGALTLAALLPPPAQMARFEWFFRATAIVLLVLAIVLTRSRTAFVLMGLPLALAAIRFALSEMGKRRALHADRRPVMTYAIAIAFLGIAAITITLAGTSGRINDTLERFETVADDPRAYIWDDATYTVERYWPVGSGMGTFDEVFQVDESLENMAVRRAGRAHNDYIEIAIEAGAPGLALVVGWLCLILWLVWRARSSPDRWAAWSGGSILLVIALQSITDYPLRNLSILALGSYGLLILARLAKPSRGRGVGS